MPAIIIFPARRYIIHVLLVSLYYWFNVSLAHSVVYVYTFAARKITLYRQLLPDYNNNNIHFIHIYIYILSNEKPGKTLRYHLLHPILRVIYDNGFFYSVNIYSGGAYVYYYIYFRSLFWTPQLVLNIYVEESTINFIFTLYTYICTIFAAAAACNSSHSRHIYFTLFVGNYYYFWTASAEPTRK